MLTSDPEKHRIVECPRCGRFAVDITELVKREDAQDFYRRTQATRTTTPVEEV